MWRHLVREVTISVQTGSDKIRTKALLCQLPINVLDDKGEEFVFEVPTFVVDFLGYEMFLGSSFLFKSKLFECMTAYNLQYIHPTRLKTL